MKKNILIIICDQLRKDSLGCYGNTKVRTPHIDSLAAGGVLFNRMYVNNPICMPNRLSLFTGQNIRSHGLWTNGLLLSQERPTLGDFLAKADYQTANVGKIHFEPYGAEADSGSREAAAWWDSITKPQKPLWSGPYWGFQYSEFTLGHTQNRAHYGRWFQERGGTNDMMKQQWEQEDPLLKGSTKIPMDFHDSIFVGERAAHYIKEIRDKSRPFMLSASFPDPHHPWNAPEEALTGYTLDDAILPLGTNDDLSTRPIHYEQMYRGAWHRSGSHEPETPDGTDRTEEKRRIVHTYAMVNLIDRGIGKILNALKDEGILEETLILFTSDHGELLGDHGLWTKGPFFFEGLISVPLIACGFSPEQEGGLTTDVLCSTIDLAPTISDALGLSKLPFANGLSQLPVLRRESKSVRENCLIEYRNGYGEEDVSSKVLITERYKYVKYETGEEELTDLKEDPRERTNLSESKEHRAILENLRIKLLEEILATEARGPEQLCHA
jgi:arylsulfatase